MINKTWFKFLEIIAGIIIAIITTWFSKGEAANKLTDAFIGFLLPYIILLPFQIQSGSAKNTQKLDMELRKLEKTNKKTYELYYTEVKELAKSVNDSCTTQIYKCSYTPNMELYKSVCAKLMSYFKGNKNNDYFCATAECSRNSINWFFDKNNLAGEFLPLLNEKCQSAKITNFKRLFIYDDDDLKNPAFYFLALLHKNIQSNKIKYCEFDFKFMNIKNYKNITKGSDFSDEMGVWGSHCVFIQKNAKSPKGYCFDNEEISKHKQKFDELWDNKLSKDFDSLNMQIEQLEPQDDFEKEILNLLRDNPKQNTISNDIQNCNLSLANIKEIQMWVQGNFPRSTT